MGGALLEGLDGVALLEEVHHWGAGIEISKPFLLPVFSILSQLPVSAATLAAVPLHQDRLFSP